jgi:predicted nucleotidyltransferase
MTQKEVLAKLRAKKPELMERYGLSRLALFGSFARDEAAEESDVDLLFAVRKEDEKFSLFDYLKLREEFERTLHRPVDLVREETLKPALRHSVYDTLIEI